MKMSRKTFIVNYVNKRRNICTLGLVKTSRKTIYSRISKEE